MLDVGSFISEDPKADSARLIERSEKLLAEALLSGSARPVRAAISFLKLKFSVTYQQLVPIARLLWSIFIGVTNNIQDEIDVADSLAFVLKLLNKLPDCPTFGSSERLLLPWKPLHDALVRVQMHELSPEEVSVSSVPQVPIGAEVRKMHSQALTSLIRRARNFFSRTAATEIIDFLRPFLCPHESGLYRAVGLLCLMVPENLNASILNEIFDLWQSVPNCLEWTYLWTHLFSRLARHECESLLPTMQSHLPRIFEAFLFIIDVPSSKDAVQRPELLSWPSDCTYLLTKSSFKNEVVKKMTRIIVYTLSPNSCTWTLLQSLFLYLQPFFNPLNEGEWTSALDMLLKMLTLNFSKRVGIERGLHRAKRLWKPASPLTSEDEEAFVQLILPHALSAFESKDYSMSFGACQSLKDLVSLQPAIVLPVIVERLIPALENTMKPHEALNSMEVFSVILGPLLRTEEGLESPIIGQMLQQTLAGIDNNDPMKTMKTLRMYMRFVTLTPLIHPSDFPGPKPEWVFILPEWTIEVVDRLWNFLSNIPSIKKGSGLDYILSRNVIRHFLDTIFQQMSPGLLDLAIKHVCKRVTTTYYPPAKKYFGQILDSAVFSNSSSSKELILLLAAKILDKNNTDLLGTGTETAYWLHLLGHVVARSGDHVVQLNKVLENILSASIMHEEKPIRKESQKLLRKILRSLSLVRPRDFRSLNPSEWIFNKSSTFSVLVHPQFDTSKAVFSLHVPDQSLVLHAQSIVEKYYGRVESILSEGPNLSQASLRSCLGCMESLIRGGAAIFPEEESDVCSRPVPQDESDIDENEGNVGLILSTTYRRTPSEWGKQMRKAMALLIKRLCDVYAIRENPDVVSVKSLIRVLQFFLSENGYRGPDRDQVNYNKSVYRLWNLGITGTFTRSMFVQKAHGLFNRRMACGVWVLSVESKGLLESLLSLSMHEYSLVRKKAQKSLPKVLTRYPSFADQIISSALVTFRSEKSSKAAVNGAIYSVNTTDMLKRVAKSWRHTSSLILGLLSSHCFEEVKVQVRLAELWRSFVPFTFRLPFATAMSNQTEITQDPAFHRYFTAPDAQTIIAVGFEAIKRLRQLQEEIFTTTLQGIIEKLRDSGKLHWRFALLSMSSLSLLLREDTPPSDEIVLQFLNGLVSDVLPMRQLCRTVLPTLMRCKCKRLAMEVSKEDSRMDIDAAALSFKSFDMPLMESIPNGRFVDGLWRGWDGTINASQNSLFLESYSVTDKSVEAWLHSKENIERFCELLAADHRLSGDERAADSDKVSVAGMPLPSAPLMSLFESALHWPRTSAASFSTAISKSNIIVIERLIRYGGKSGAEVFFAPLNKVIVKYTDREAQCLAAELVSGLIRATISSDAVESDMVISRMHDTLQSTFINMTLESCGDWMEALRFCICNRDPRRFQNLSQAVAYLPSLDVSSSNAITSLKLKQALLIEFGWRGYSFAAIIVDQLFSLLSGLSKSVREESARCLVLVSLIDACLPSSTALCRSRLSTSESVSRELLSNRLSGKAESLLEAYTRHQQDANKGSIQKLKEEIEGVLYFFIHGCRLGRLSSTSPFVSTALPLMLAIYEDSDREFAQLGKIASQLAGSGVDFRILSDLISSAAKMYSKASSWRVRLGSLDVIRIIAHRMALDSTARCSAVSVFKQALTDCVIEVRGFAHLCLAGLFRMIPSEDIQKIVAAAPKYGGRKGKNQAQTADSIEVRHGKVLELSAIVLSHPTDLPDWMPEAITALCLLNDDDPVIKQTIIHTIGEFKKTHQDLWPMILITWSSDQLSLISDFAGSRSYYS